MRTILLVLAWLLIKVQWVLHFAVCGLICLERWLSYDG
jgi:hypothetical protein